MNKGVFVVLPLMVLCMSSNVFAAAPKKQGLSGAIAIAKNAVGCRESDVIYANLDEKVSTMVISPKWKVVKENKNAALILVTGKVKAEGRKNNQVLSDSTSTSLYPVQAQHASDYSDLFLKNIEMGFLLNKDTRQVDLVGGIFINGIHGMVMKDNQIQGQMCLESLKKSLKKWSNITDDFTVDKFHKVYDVNYNEIHVWEVSFENRGRNGAEGLIAIDIPKRKAKELPSGGVLLPVDFNGANYYITKSYGSGQGTFGGGLQLVTFDNANAKELLSNDYFGGYYEEEQEQENKENKDAPRTKNVAWGMKTIGDTQYFSEFVEIGSKKECNFYELNASGATKISLDALGIKAEECFPFDKMFIDTSATE